MPDYFSFDYALMPDVHYSMIIIICAISIDLLLLF